MMNENLEWKTGKPTEEGPYVIVEFVEHNGIIFRNVSIAFFSHVGKRKPFFWRKEYKTHKRINMNQRVKFWCPLPTFPPIPKELN